MDEKDLKIGQRLKDLRTTKRLKLDEVAEMTGVSKAMISQIERGKTVPSVTTLWKLSKGLKVSFTFFLEEEEVGLEVKKIENTEGVIDEDGLVLYPFFPFDHQSGIEMFLLTLTPKSTHVSKAHAPGLIEYITVIKGELSLVYDGHSYSLKVGQSIRFKGNVTHEYHNETDQELVFQNVIVNAL